MQFSYSPTTYQPPRESLESSEGELTPEDSDLVEPPELEPGGTSFSEDQQRVQRKRDPLLNCH